MWVWCPMIASCWTRIPSRVHSYLVPIVSRIDSRATMILKIKHLWKMNEWMIDWMSLGFMRITRMYTCDVHCSQVETIRDAYMVVAGVPNKTTFHAHHICDMALDMLSSIDHLKDPSTGDNIQIRVGRCTLTTEIWSALYSFQKW